MDLDWIPAACALPTAEKPLRQTEFVDLFSTAREVEHADGATSARLVLTDAADRAGLARRTRTLTAAETECCSFFGFRVAEQGSDVVLDVTVPPAHVDVLDGLVALARAAS